MTEKLKPCPICAADQATMMVGFGSDSGFAVKCGKCGTTGPNRTTLIGATDGWNLRTSPPLPAADAELVERLRNYRLPLTDAAAARIEALSRPAVTEAMVEAGVDAIWSVQGASTGDFTGEDMARAVFQAMLAAKEAG